MCGLNAGTGRRIAVLVALMLALAVALGASTPESRTGAWVDEVVFFEEGDMSKAVDMMEAGKADVYALGITDPNLFKRIVESKKLTHESSYGSFNEILLNPCTNEAGEPFFEDGTFNPFGLRSVREAMQYLVDRRHITEEIMKGLGTPMYTFLLPTMPPYASIADQVRAIELKYAHNKKKARELIEQSMTNYAKLVKGKWHYNNKPVELIFLIRTEDERKEIGGYVGSLLKDMGFSVKYRPGTSRELAAIWLLSDPCKGGGVRWHLYTGGWISNKIDRDQGSDCDFFYTPRGWPVPLNQAFNPSPPLDGVCDPLCRRDYSTEEELKGLLAEAIRLTTHEGWRVWTHVCASAWPHPKDVGITADLAGGISGSYLWPYSLRKVDADGSPVPGGTIKFASPSILTQPWNPIAGSNGLYDAMIYRATEEHPTKPDPFTGLFHPQRVKKAEVYVLEGLPVNEKPLDWIKLNFVPEIQVPPDAWIDWDAEKQVPITVGEKYPNGHGLTARTKTVVYFDDNLFQTYWHDGSQFSLGDIVMSYVIFFDRGKNGSAIYDEAHVPTLQSFQMHFKGYKIVQKDPLIIEFYDDRLYLDAEWIANEAASCFWPVYDQGTAPWHVLALGILAEADKKLAFSKDKADNAGMLWMNLISLPRGPSHEYLKEYLKKASEELYIPYGPTLGKYVSTGEAKSRYELLEKWRKDKGHFWVGQGPFYLHSVDPTAKKKVILKRFERHPDLADKWLRFAEPRIAKVEIRGPSKVKIGAAADFDIGVTFKGEPYPTDEIDFVKFLVIDDKGELAITGVVRNIRDGQWRVELTAVETGGLLVGSTGLEVVVAVKPVALTSTGSFTFVTVSP
ncbi:ABC transporter substrate-binding protein [Candidatus Bipolaricaulota bacterium]|nr:ABC transporter substrate-binding protein [Candidatus Bipolaricaulota bacterium]